MYRDYIRNIIDKNARILEFGPLNAPIFRKEIYTKVKYADIRTTEEVKKLYSGNLYLKKTGIDVDPDSIVDIDYVIDKKYKDFFRKEEKFDVVVLAHVIEHMQDIIDFFEDVQTILKPDGKLIIVYPDKRYCFDYYRNSISFREACYIHKYPEYKQYLIADFLSNVISYNNPPEFWEKNKIIEQYRLKNTDTFSEYLVDAESEDVHYFPFDPISFYKLLIDMTNEKILNLKIQEVKLTLPNTQEFLVILSKENFDNKKIIKDYYDKYADLILEDNELNQRTIYKVQSHEALKDIFEQYELLKIKCQEQTKEQEEQKKKYEELEKFSNNKYEEIKQFYENSTSMKITQPLRSFKNIINKITKK